MNHSNVVGGSTAKRVINCPASVALCAKMPPRPSNEHADRGTLLHNVIAEILEFDKKPEQLLGATYQGQTLTQELLDEKIIPALQALEEIDADKIMEYMVETRVGFGDFLPGVFGSTDLLGRIGSKAVVLDWKFGDGVVVPAENNPQLLFYAAAAMRTTVSAWVFDDASEIECIIVQPPEVRRWTTTIARVKEFEQELAHAVRVSTWPTPPMQTGDHCRWCAARPICPEMTGAAERALRTQLADLPIAQLAVQLKQADMIEDYLRDLRALAFQMLENNQQVPGYKLVAKRATRQWLDEAKVVEWAYANKLGEVTDTKLKSPAQLEKVAKKFSIEIPTGLVTSISSGSTLAVESDPRPAVVNLGAALARLIKLP